MPNRKPLLVLLALLTTTAAVAQSPGVGHLEILSYDPTTGDFTSGPLEISEDYAALEYVEDAGELTVLLVHAAPDPELAFEELAAALQSLYPFLAPVDDPASDVVGTFEPPDGKSVGWAYPQGPNGNTYELGIPVDRVQAHIWNVLDNWDIAQSSPNEYFGTQNPGTAPALVLLDEPALWPTDLAVDDERIAWYGTLNHEDPQFEPWVTGVHGGVTRQAVHVPTLAKFALQQAAHFMAIRGEVTLNQGQLEGLAEAISDGLTFQIAIQPIHIRKDELTPGKFDVRFNRVARVRRRRVKERTEATWFGNCETWVPYILGQPSERIHLGLQGQYVLIEFPIVPRDLQLRVLAQPSPGIWVLETVNQVPQSSLPTAISPYVAAFTWPMNAVTGYVEVLGTSAVPEGAIEGHAFVWSYRP